MSEIKYLQGLLKIAYIAVCAFCAYLFFRFLFAPLLPFLIAWLIAMLIRPLIISISKHTKIPRKIVSFVLVFLIYALATRLICFLFARLAAELYGIAGSLADDIVSGVGDIYDYILSLADKIPSIERLAGKEEIRRGIISAIEGSISSVTSRLPIAIMEVFSSLPGIILFTVALVLSTFYFSADVSKINLFITSLLPKKAEKNINNVKKKLREAGGKYLRAYLSILLITFLQLLVGFMILKVQYPLTLSAVIAAIDILPVFGVGTALIPWAAVCFIRSDTYLGFGLIIVFVVSWIIRQIIEPKIIGHSMGIHPLATLIAMYVGCRLIGIAGLFLFPIGTIIVKCLYDVGIIPKLADRSPK